MDARDARTSRRSLIGGLGGIMAGAALMPALAGEPAHAEEQATDERIRRLVDYLDICECQYRYAQGCDFKDPDLLASAFDTTIDLDYSATGVVMEGTDAAQFAANMVDSFAAQDITTQHYMNVYQVTIDGDAASARTYLRATHKKEGSDFYIVGGYYDNEYVRTEAGWRIKRVCLTYTYEEGETYF